MSCRKLFSILTLIIALMSFSSAIAQQEKKSVKLGMNYLQINDQISEVQATVKSKVGKKFQPVENVVVEFFLGEQSVENAIGKSKTNGKGVASVELSSVIASKLDSLSPFKMTAYFSGDKNYDEQSEEIEITRAKIELMLSEVDSSKRVQAQLLALKNGKWMGVPEVEMKLFVRRAFSDLSLTENALTTNENGEVETEYNFKTPVPGGANGNIIVGAKLEDNENYGTVIALKYAKWGALQKPDTSFDERSLFASRDKTPIWLLVFPNLVIVIVWGLVFYMLFLIYRIRKVGLENKTDIT